MQNYNSASGGRPWPQYVAQYSDIHLYNYAVSGAVCSNDITPRTYRPGILFPSVEEYEVPAFIADSEYVEPNGDQFMINPPDETVYSIWIGTNDLGNKGFLTDQQVRGTNIVNYTDCVFDALKQLYDQGGRYFVLQNIAPLNLAPVYALPEDEGVAGKDKYWLADWPLDNQTAMSYRMLEQVATVNAIFEYQTPFVKRISREFEDARFAIFDMHALVSLPFPLSRKHIHLLTLPCDRFRTSITTQLCISTAPHRLMCGDSTTSATRLEAIA